MTNEEQADLVRKKIAHEIISCASTYTFGSLLEYANHHADQILSIPELWIEHPEQELPKNPYDKLRKVGKLNMIHSIYSLAQYQMKNLGYRRVIKGKE